MSCASGWGHNRQAPRGLWTALLVSPLVGAAETLRGGEGAASPQHRLQAPEGGAPPQSGQAGNLTLGLE